MPNPQEKALFLFTFQGLQINHTNLYFLDFNKCMQMNIVRLYEAHGFFVCEVIF